MGFPVEQGFRQLLVWYSFSVLLRIAVSPFPSKQSYPSENSHSNTSTLSSFELLSGDIPLPNSPLPMHVFSASSMNQPDAGGDLNTAISTETPTCGRLLSEGYMLSSPQWDLHATISSVMAVCGHHLAEVYARPSPQGLPGVAISSARPTHDHLLSKARGASTAPCAMLTTAWHHVQRHCLW